MNSGQGDSLEEAVQLDIRLSFKNGIRPFNCHGIFSEYGNVLEIIAKTNLKSKGQAFIVFDDADSAQNAIDEVQGFQLFDKPMQVALAKTRSDATVKTQGSEEDFEAHRRRRLAEKDKKRALEAAEEQKRMQRSGAGAATDAAGRPAKAARGAGLKSSNPAASSVVPDEYLPPNKILFIQNLPEDFDIEALTDIFGRFDGFREVRLVPGRRGIAFVEYDGEQGAITAKENTAGMVLGESSTIKVTYQRQ
ncbi:U1 small nuclear ribonucleoprotein like [Verticillium longisporum]|nr:U1 small nuclear ribonucleoprotein like [Verticillium longisporum]